MQHDKNEPSSLSATHEPPVSPARPNRWTILLQHKRWIDIAVAAVLLLGTGTFVLVHKLKHRPPVYPHASQSVSSVSPDQTLQHDPQYPGLVTGTGKGGDPTSKDPVKRGQALSGDACHGTGSKKLSTAAMRPSDISIIVPYGLLAGGHVTPVDHQYYWGKVQNGNPDMYDVLAPSDGRIVNIGYRAHPAGSKVKGDYRVVISYSCTFFSYFDLATSLSSDIQKLLPPDWEHKQNPVLNTWIDVKEGQVLGKMGGQSLDYAVWDTTHYLQRLLVSQAYDVAEPWKIVTVHPLDYYTAPLKQQLLPLYGRAAEPRDGTIDQDIDGKFMGNWFVDGTYGYAGSAQATGGEYYKGHLAMVHDLFDDNAMMFSIGDFNGQPMQFVVKNPSITYDKADATSGLVKYELAQFNNYTDNNGQQWMMQAPAKGVTVRMGPTQGTALVQMLETRKLKVEVFPGKTPAQVSGFTAAAKIYTRGEDAKNASAITSPGAPTSTAH